MTPLDIPPSLGEIAEALTSAGVPTTLDPTTVPVPGAWLTLQAVTPDLLGGLVSAVAELVLVAPDVGHVAAMTYLLDMYGDVIGLITAASQGTPDAVALPGHPGPLPALRLTFPLGD